MRTAALCKWRSHYWKAIKQEILLAEGWRSCACRGRCGRRLKMECSIGVVVLAGVFGGRKLPGFDSRLGSTQEPSEMLTAEGSQGYPEFRSDLAD